MSSENQPAPVNAGTDPLVENRISERTIIEEERVRKRQEIGLAPRRPTARPTVQRPPRDLFSVAQRWLLTLLLFGILISTGLLVVAKSSGAPTSWLNLRNYGQALMRGEPWPALLGQYIPGANYRLRFSDDFNERTGIVACTQQAGEWISDVVPDLGVYRMELWPGRLTWSTIALVDPFTSPTAAYHVAASMTVVDVMPSGYGGYIGRYQDPENFYLFMVDGMARYQIQLWQNGALTTLQPWTENVLLNPAGFENLLTLEDNGEQLIFSANGSPLATVSTPILPRGEIGLMGGASERTMAEIQVDWLRIYELLN